MTAPWRCSAHGTLNTGDCPRCDAELIALTEGTAAAACSSCGRTLPEGTEAWAADWTVIEPAGPRVKTRYTCDDCATPDLRTVQDQENARQSAEALRALHDPMSGRLDNWSER